MNSRLKNMDCSNKGPKVVFSERREYKIFKIMKSSPR